MLTSILANLISKKEFRANTLIVNLNGYIHNDDSAALKSITKQMQLETAVDGKVFTTFADNLSFLLDCLRSVDRKQSKSVIFILDEFDLFCVHGNQTLIYNLFDVSQSAQAPICVVGMTRRNDVIELLEKRVKSRFSHRQIFLFNENPDLDNQIDVFLDFLKLPKIKEFDTKEYRELKKHSKASDILRLRHDFDVIEYKGQLKDDFITKWNKEITNLRANKTIISDLEHLFDFNATLAVQKTLLFRIASCIDHDKGAITSKDLVSVIHRVIAEGYLQSDSKIAIMRDLSILELSLMIAIKHHNDIYDRDPFNFEIILTRLHKFQSSGQMEPTDRAVVLKAFDVLKVSSDILSKFFFQFIQKKIFINHFSIWG